jgi:predicted 3-demethylubiquinone-9 3-methyltransferase (glyoxalase superfamily)
MQKIAPFLWFDGKAEESMNFYISIFKDSKIVSVTRAKRWPAIYILVGNIILGEL